MNIDEQARALVSAARPAGLLMHHIAEASFKVLTEAIQAEREACAQVAEAIDSGRGNEAEIAIGIRARK